MSAPAEAARRDAGRPPERGRRAHALAISTAPSCEHASSAVGRGDDDDLGLDDDDNDDLALEDIDAMLDEFAVPREAGKRTSCK